MFVRSFFLSLLFLTVVLADADGGQNKAIDRAGGATGTKYFVQFVERSSQEVGTDDTTFPGHAYVTWITTQATPDGETQDFKAVGFYPKQTEWQCGLLTCTGKLRDEFYDEKGTYLSWDKKKYKDGNVLQVQVTRKVYDLSRAKAESWKRKKLEYQFFFKNCVTYNSEIAKAIGLKVPSGAIKTPSQLIQGLQRLND